MCTHYNCEGAQSLHHTIKCLLSRAPSPLPSSKHTFDQVSIKCSRRALLDDIYYPADASAAVNHFVGCRQDNASIVQALESNVSCTATIFEERGYAEMLQSYTTYTANEYEEFSIPASLRNKVRCARDGCTMVIRLWHDCSLDSLHMREHERVDSSWLL